MPGESLTEGTVLAQQGEPFNEIILLNSGSLEILQCDPEYNGLDQDIVLSKSRRLGVLQGKVIVSGFNEAMTGAMTVSLRAVNSCDITRYPVPPSGIAGLAASDQGQTVTVLRQIYTVLNTLVKDGLKEAKLYANLSKVRDNMALLYKGIVAGAASDNLDSYADEKYALFKSRGGEVPQQLDARYLITDNGQKIGINYDRPSSQFQTIVSGENCELVRRLLKLNPSILAAMFKADPEIAAYIYRNLFRSIAEVLQSLGNLSDEITAAAAMTFNEDDSWAAFLAKGGIDDWTAAGRVKPDFLKQFLSLTSKLNGAYEEATGRALTKEFGGVRLIHEKYSSSKTSAAPKQEAAAGGGAQKPMSAGALKNSLQQIFEFSVVDSEFRTKFLKLLQEFKDMETPFSTDNEGRKLRRNLTNLYWDMYKKAYVRSTTQKDIPRAVSYMLRYGFIDEELLEPEQIDELNSLDRERDKAGTVPVLLETDFLEMIYKGEEEPSINEMGLNFDAFLREQEKRSGRRKDAAPEEEVDEHVAKVSFEIEQRLKSASAVCSGSTATAFPILTKELLKGSLKSFFLTKEKVEAAVTEVRGIDFSAFYRETVLKLGEAREIIKEEVIPYFVLLPVFGTKILMWQELVGTNKRSRGRIMIPIFFMGDLRKEIAHAIASFRWELTRTMKGAMWADPIEGGVTGEYFDYVNTYKKNNKLSTEAKQKITERFKSLRTNRERFADDYITWLFYEKDGIMKLNIVVREMFYKHIPFNKEIRDRLENMPAFTQMATRYKNIANRNYQHYERRFKKYQDDGGNYPPEIDDYFTFLAM